jgi:hypothetical protein
LPRFSNKLNASPLHRRERPRRRVDKQLEAGGFARRRSRRFLWISW